MTLTLTPTPRIAVNGVSLYVRMTGRGEPLVLLHGFTGSSRSWLPHVAEFKSHHFCISVDLLGHGGSDVPLDPARYRMDKQIDDLLDVFDALGLGQVNLMGYSMGGRVALSFAIAHPERVRSLVIESASPGITDPAERRERIRNDEVLAESIENEGLEKFVEHWERLPLFATQNALPQALRDELRQQRLRNSPRGLINSLRGLGTGVQPPVWDKLGKLTMPVMLMVGEFDQKYTSIALRMAAKIPKVKVAIIEGAGHTIHLEKPATFNRVLLHFLESVTAEQELRARG
ncbi:MAG: 2-succinyl-6-hydroxy-2,4-cyclohexadiene-1-carboxylate synthase [Anaerolineae bacterium]